ncbi:glycosyltransferase family 39 protein [Myxosarcina sp. GI1]|uniref:glycosyltransferase family 39 protein n=1 Tax=Myxosarcina sp. GI1 TaxID=1541065 RepID=UPI0006893FED|nr:glycosyltransferase family 39 protein [Myxosarcina sp. GI1]
MNFSKLRSDRLTIFILVILLLGIWLRFTNLERQVYWIDEVHTSLRAAGYSRTEFVEQAPDGYIVGREDLQKFQQLTPERNFIAGVKAIASSEHSPLYYVLARLGMELFGSSIAVTRGVAALISLLAFPCIYLLAKELFNSSLVGLIAMALLAVSPFHLLYAREAREYSLLTVTILLSSWVLLKAIKHNHKSYWSWYGISVALCLYAHPLAIFALIAHGIYVAVGNKFSWQRLKAYFIASGTGILLFIPWIVVFIVNGDGVGSWIERKIDLGVWLQRWILNLSSIFFDLQVGYSDRLFDVESGQDLVINYSNWLNYLIIPILLFIIYALYFVVRHAPKSARLFVLLLIGCTAIGLGLPDLISGGQRSTVGRYIIPLYLGIELAAAYCLASKITTVKNSEAYRFVWRIVTVVLISLGVWCSLAIVRSPTWWNKYSSYYNPQIASVINNYNNPLVIGNTNRISRLTSLSYLLNSDAKFLLLDINETLPEIGDRKNIFLFRPYSELIETVEQDNRYALKSIFLDYLWRVKNRS